jgi:hypothetical protein
LPNAATSLLPKTLTVFSLLYSLKNSLNRIELS